MKIPQQMMKISCLHPNGVITALYRPLIMGRKKRLQISLSDEMWPILERFREQTGLSPASFASTLLEENKEMFITLGNIYEKAREGNTGTLVQELTNMLDSAVVDTVQLRIDLEAEKKKQKVRKGIKRIK